MQKKVYMCLMTAGMVTVLTSCENNLTGKHKTEEKEEISVEASIKGNPVTGFDAGDGDRATLCVSSQAGCRMGCSHAGAYPRSEAAELHLGQRLRQHYCGDRKSVV